MIGELEFVNEEDADGLDIVDSKVDDGESALEMIYDEDTGETPEIEMELSINSGSESNAELKPKNHKWWGHRKPTGTDTPAKEHKDNLSLLMDDEFLDLQRRAAESSSEEQLEIVTKRGEPVGRIELELESSEEDGWSGKLYTPRLKIRNTSKNRQPTMRSWFKTLRDTHGMDGDITFDTFLEMNGDSDGRVPHRDTRPTHRTKDGDLGYLNIPTVLNQIRDDETAQEKIVEQSLWPEDASSESGTDESKPARSARALSAFILRRRCEFNGTQAKCKYTKWYIS